MPLSDNLVSYYKLEEASGNRADSVGVNTLTSNNSVGSAAGKLDNSASFSGTNQYLSVVSTDFQVGDLDFTICGWVKFNAIPTAGNYVDFISKDNGSSSREFILEYDGGANRLIWYVRKLDNSGWVSASWSAAFSANTWYFVAAGYDSVNDKSWISINAGTRVQTNWSGGVKVGTAALCLGGTSYGSYYLNGLMDEWGFYKNRSLLDADISQLYNSGNGFNPVSYGGTISMVPMQIETREVHSLAIGGCALLVSVLRNEINIACLGIIGDASISLPAFPVETRFNKINPALFIASFEYVLMSLSIVPEYQFEQTILPGYSIDQSVLPEYQTSLEIQPCPNAS